MEGADDDHEEELEEEVAPLALGLGDIDRAALATHCAAVAHHMGQLARLFNPAVKAPGAGAGAHKGKKADDGVPRPKREPTAYNMFMQQRLLQVKAAVRAHCEADARDNCPRS
jgi:hypothetical protein